MHSYNRIINQESTLKLLVVPLQKTFNIITSLSPFATMFNEIKIKVIPVSMNALLYTTNTNVSCDIQTRVYKHDICINIIFNINSKLYKASALVKSLDSLKVAIYRKKK